MRRSLGAIFALVSGCVMAHAQHIVFTMRTHPSCPVMITSVSPSKEFGFEQVTLLDDSGKPSPPVNAHAASTATASPPPAAK